MAFGGATPSRKGPLIALEPFDDWKIQEIGYNGVERYIRPESFADHVGKLARQVDWKKVVGSDAIYDNPSLVEENADTEEEEEPKTVPIEERVIPEAGPWHPVAKNLHESLQQLNVLLDNLTIMRNTDYMKPLTILDPIHTESSQQQADTVANSKAVQWVWKRRALGEATSVLDRAIERMNMVMGNGESNESQEKGQFFMELKKMREYWRIRKTGDHIYGDLGFHIFGSKYNPRELFDISRRSQPTFFLAADHSWIPPSSMSKVSSNEKVIQSVLQVTVPRDLTRRSTISVSIVKDDQTTKNLFASLDDAQFEFMRLDVNKTDNIHWDNALKWAQETLICRDTFDTLCSEAVQMRTHLSTIRDGVLLISLHDGQLLRIELKYHPFRDGIIVADGDAYLNRSLRQMLVARECTRWIRPQLFVSLPTSNLSEALDIRGPKAFTQKEIDERAFKPQYLLEKMLEVSNHYSLVKMVVETLKEFIMDDPDPQMHWRFLRCTPTNSQLMIILTNRTFDYIVGKTTYYMRISSDAVCLVSKEGHVIECYRDKKLLMYSLKHMLCSFSVTSVSSLAKMWWWLQGLHANMNALDNEGNPAPTLYMCNASSSRHILIQFSIDHPPTIKIRSEVAQPIDNPGEDTFVQLNYRRIPGSSLLKKMDNLFSLLRESEVLGSL